MDLEESLSVLCGEATKYSGRSHSELSSLIEEPVHLQVAGPKGTKFQVEVSASWDHKPGQSLRLFFSVDDGGVRAFLPLTRDALVLPGGVFDGELH